MTGSPTLSIITPSLNRAGYIGDAIASVVAQGYTSTEHIVVDGGSTDGTLDLLERYPQVRIVRGRDQGMYDAVNKGLALAGGDVVGLLNSDDLYAEAVFPEVMGEFKDGRILAVVGRAVVFSEAVNGSPVVVDHFFPDRASLLELSTIGSPFINAWFFRKSVFAKVGHFNTDYRIAADRDFMIRAALSGLEYRTLDRITYRYRRHSGALTFDVTDEKLERIVGEHVQMTSRYLQKRDLPGKARRLIREARTRDTIVMAARSARKGDLRKAVFFMAAGMKYDLAWGAKFIRRVLRGAARQASRGLDKAIPR